MHTCEGLFLDWIIWGQKTCSKSYLPVAASVNWHGRKKRSFCLRALSVPGKSSTLLLCFTGRWTRFFRTQHRLRPAESPSLQDWKDTRFLAFLSETAIDGVQLVNHSNKPCFNTQIHSLSSVPVENLTNTGNINHNDRIGHLLWHFLRLLRWLGTLCQII